jgi:hypothetical protein
MPQPLELTLELVRAEDAGDRYAVRPGRWQEYLLRDPDDSGRYADGSFRWSDEVQAHLQAVEHAATADAAVAQLGALLRAFLKDTPWRQYEPWVARALEEGRPVVLTIRSAAAELYALPWELLPIGGHTAAELPGCLVRTCWPDEALQVERLQRAIEVEPLQATEPDETGRLLVAWSAAGGGVPIREHLQVLSQVTAAGRVDFDRDRDVVARASRERLAEALTPDVAVLHLLCHGAQGAEGFGLALDRDNPGDNPVTSAEELARLLAPHADHLTLVVLCACHGGHTGPLGGQAGSVAQALHRVGIRAVVASRYPLSAAGSVRLTSTLYETLLVRLGSLEGGLLAARAEALASTAPLDGAALQLYAHPRHGADTRPFVFRPYRGLLAFDARHARFFHGRAGDIEQLLQAVRRLVTTGGPRLLIVAGASGTGKSSVVLAGLVPSLGSLPGVSGAPIVLRPGEEPDLEALALKVGASQGGEAPLIIVDQLEELFTALSPDQRQAMMTALWTLSDPSTGPGAVVIGTLRIEYVGRFGELSMPDGRRFDQISLDDHHRVFLRQLSPDQLREVIERPAHQVGLHLEPGLLERLLPDVGAEPGALPLLSYTLDLLWSYRRGPALTDKTYDTLGRLVGAVAETADRLHEGLDPAARHQLRRLLGQLVQGSSDPRLATRRRGRLDRLRPADAAGEAFDRAVAAFVEARLLVRDATPDQSWVEIAHEALIRGWATLQRWLREDREWLAFVAEVRDQAEAWEAAPPRSRNDHLLSGTRLAYAAGMWERHREHLGRGDQALIGSFVEAGLSAERWRWRVGVVALLTLAAAGILAAVITNGLRASAVRAQGVAEAKTLEVERRSALALSDAVARESADTTDLADALLLAVEATRFEPYAPVARRTLAALVYPQVVGVGSPGEPGLLLEHLLPAPEVVEALWFAPDDDRLFVHSEDMLYWWDLEAGTRGARRVLGEPASLVVDGPGERVARCDEDGLAVASVEGLPLWEATPPNGRCRQHAFDRRYGGLVVYSGDTPSALTVFDPDGAVQRVMAVPDGIGNSSVTDLRLDGYDALLQTQDAWVVARWLTAELEVFASRDTFLLDASHHLRFPSIENGTREGLGRALASVPGPGWWFVAGTDYVALTDEHGRAHRAFSGLEASPDRARPLAVSRDGARVAARIGPSIRVWRTGERSADDPPGELLGVDEQSGRRAWQEVGPGSAVRVRAADGTPFGVPLVHEAMVTEVAFLSAGTRLATVAEGVARVWDIGTGLQLLPPVRVSPSPWVKTHLLAHGDRLVVHADVGAPRYVLWDPMAGLDAAELRVIEGKDHPFLPDRRREHLLYLRGRTLELWDLAQARALPLGAPEVEADTLVRIDPDGRGYALQQRLFSHRPSGSAVMSRVALFPTFDATEPSYERLIEGSDHAAEVWSDEGFVVLQDHVHTGTRSVWDLTDEGGALAPYLRAVGVQLTPDRQQALVTPRAAPPVLIPLTLESLRARACALAGRNLSRDVWDASPLTAPHRCTCPEHPPPSGLYRCDPG